MCLCSRIRELAKGQDAGDILSMASDLNRHLADLRTVLAKSKSLTRDVRYSVVPNNQRTMKILNVQSIDYTKANQTYQHLHNNVSGLWGASSLQVHAELRRRLACVIIFLRSRIDTDGWMTPDISSIVQGQKISELRYAGRKYIKIARKLGGIGAVLWLPLDVPSSTYERYLNMADEDVFDHLRQISSDAPNLNHHVQRVISKHFDENPQKLSKYSLLAEYADVLPNSDLLLLLTAALGGSEIPVDLLTGAQSLKHQWTEGGEIESITALDFGFHSNLVTVLSDETSITQTSQHQDIVESTLDDGTAVWSMSPGSRQSLLAALSSESEECLANQTLRLLCYACPPYYEGKVNWPSDKKKIMWTLLDQAIESRPPQASMRSQCIEALLFFCERDGFTIRRLAFDRAKQLLRKSMPWHLHASVALFESIILRIEGKLEKSSASLSHMLEQAHDGSRYDNAVRGRLHISLIENKIHLYDKNVSSDMYRWEGIQPLSTFEIEVTRRLQGTAAKYFHSVGDFLTARASLEQHLWLNSTRPIRLNTRLLIVSRLAEIHCELQEPEQAVTTVHSEVDNIEPPNRKGRPFRRLLLILVDASLELGQADVARDILQELAGIEPPELDDLNDQFLHMRRVLLIARASHTSLRFEEAIQYWDHARQRVQILSIFQSRHKWTEVVIHLSLAHCYLEMGDETKTREEWDLAVEISRTQKCEYAIPVLSSIWLQKVVTAIHAKTGWPFRVMRPGGKSDITWP